MARGGFIELAGTWNHPFAVRKLTGPHLDPFDRLLIAQSRIEGLTMVTNDSTMRRYQLDLLW